ncbi:MAG TPA: PaaI family thioesterase [Jatrophihabitans sp.]|jgi:acyl-coenzyme A thioesterase PaaI-like protein
MTAHSTSPFPDEQAREEAWKAAVAEERGGKAYGELIAAQRRLQDSVAGAVLPHDLVTEITDRLNTIGDLLAEHQAAEPDRWDGWRPDIPGRAMPVLPPYVIDERGEGFLRGHVTFTRFYLGGNGAAHGGSHTLLFDDVMGHVAGLAGGICRTAYLTINYRRITPIGVELNFECRLDGVEGRKRFISARLFNPAGEVVADCDGLFLRLLPGQQ